MARASRNGRSTSKDIAEIEQEIGELMRDLEDRLRRLNTLTRRGTTHAGQEASQYISDTVADVAARLRGGARSATDDAAHIGHDALRRIEEEVEQRPLLTLSIAAGIGFLAGMAGRRH